jgi:hypothetical protein
MHKQLSTGCVYRTTPSRAAPVAAIAAPPAVRTLMASRLRHQPSGTAHMGPSALSPFHTANVGTRNSAHVLSVGALKVVRATPTSMAAHAAGRMSAGGVAHVGGALRLTAETKCTAAAVPSNTTAAAGGRGTWAVSVSCNALQSGTGFDPSYARSCTHTSFCAITAGVTRGAMRANVTGRYALRVRVSREGRGPHTAAEAHSVDFRRGEDGAVLASEHSTIHIQQQVQCS